MARLVVGQSLCPAVMERRAHSASAILIRLRGESSAWRHGQNHLNQRVLATSELRTGDNVRSTPTSLTICCARRRAARLISSRNAAASWSAQAASVLVPPSSSARRLTPNTMPSAVRINLIFTDMTSRRRVTPFWSSIVGLHTSRTVPIPRFARGRYSETSIDASPG